jgi:hypothetical protein
MTGQGGRARTQVQLRLDATLARSGGRMQNRSGLPIFSQSQLFMSLTARKPRSSGDGGTSILRSSPTFDTARWRRKVGRSQFAGPRYTVIFSFGTEVRSNLHMRPSAFLTSWRPSPSTVQSPWLTMRGPHREWLAYRLNASLPPLRKHLAVDEPFQTSECPPTPTA